MKTPKYPLNRLYVCEDAGTRAAWAARTLEDVIAWKKTPVDVTVYDRAGPEWRKTAEFSLT